MTRSFANPVHLPPPDIGYDYAAADVRANEADYANASTEREEMHFDAPFVHTPTAPRIASMADGMRLFATWRGFK